MLGLTLIINAFYWSILLLITIALLLVILLLLLLPLPPQSFGINLCNHFCNSFFFKPLKGKVSIVAKPGVKLEIPDGAVLENKVKYYNMIDAFDSQRRCFNWANCVDFFFLEQEINGPVDL